MRRERAWRIGLLLSDFTRRTRRGVSAPFEVFYLPVDNLTGEGPPLLAASIGVWLMRSDLQELFDIETPEGRLGFLGWQLNAGVTEYELLRAAFDRPEVRSLYRNSPAPEPPPASTRKPRKSSLSCGGVNLLGHLHARLGVGEDVRCAAAALEAAKIPHVLLEAPVGPEFGSERHAFATDTVLDPVYETTLHFTAPWETFRRFCVQGDALWRDGRNICAWPWELPQWPEALGFITLLADEVWAISTHVRRAFERVAPAPVVTMPSCAVATAKPDRACFGLPEDAFVFIAFFDGKSGFARKNPLAAVRAFRAAFSASEPVRLVVKSMRAEANNLKALAQAAEDDRRIALVDDEWERQDVLNLLASCDALISLHRAEGFGRPIAEAVLLGKTVIATDWSGNVDFIKEGRQLPVACALTPIGDGDYPWSDGQSWAETDAEAAVAALREAVRIGRGPAPQTRDHFAPETAGARYRHRLEILGVV